MTSVDINPYFVTGQSGDSVEAVLNEINISTITSTIVYATNIVYTGTLNGIPTGGIATDSSTQTFSNKNLVDNSTYIVDEVDNTIRINFTMNGSAGTTQILRFNQTANTILDFPAGNDTIVARDSVDTMQNKTFITPTMTSYLNGGVMTLPSGTDTIVARNTTDTLTGKTLTDPIIARISDGTNLHTIPPGAADTFTFLNRTQTLQNKTFITPTIQTILYGTGTLNLPLIVGTDTIMTATSTHTSVTNKTFIVGSTVFSGTGTMSFGITGGSTTALNFISTAPRTISFPDSDGTVVLGSSSQTLSNKIFETNCYFVDPVIGANQLHFSLTGNTAATFPAGSITVAALSVAQTFSAQQTFSSSIKFAPGNFVTINATNPAANRSYTIPDTGVNSTFLMSGINLVVNTDSVPKLILKENATAGVHNVYGNAPGTTTYNHILQNKSGTVAGTTDRMLNFTFDGIVTTTVTSFTRLKSFVYIGSNNIAGGITKLVAVVFMSGVDKGDIRLYDIRNAQVLAATSTSIVGNGSDQYIELTGFSNIPTNPASLEFQGKVTTGTLQLKGLVIQL